MIKVRYMKINNNLDLSKFENLDYKSSEKKLQTLNSKYLLDIMLKDENILNYNIQINQNNKPYLLNEKIKFNISHSYHYVVCALSNFEVGVDIEKISEKVLRIRKRFSSDEIDDTYELTKIWTLKEAFIKYIGLGFKIPLLEIKIKKDKLNYIISYQKYIGYGKVIKIDNYYLSVVSNNIDKIDILEHHI